MVIALDKRKRPLGFITERRARILMEKRRAVNYRVYPSVVIIKDVDSRTIDTLPTYRIKIDPGSKYTGIAVVDNATNEVMFYAKIEHRGDIVRKNKETQKGARRHRRNRETRYRRCKFRKKGKYDSNREAGWLPPSVKSVADNIINFIRKLSKRINITECSFESVRFDTQLMDNPDIQGIEYQQGELLEYEIREYILDKYGHTCQYCGGASEDTVLQWEHIIPKAKGGTNKVKNATLACNCCNKEKGSKTLKEWKQELMSKSLYKTGIKKKKELRTKKENLVIEKVSGIEKVETEKVTIAKNYCAWVNSSRKYVEKYIFNKFSNVECSSGGRTKYNRIKVLNLPKDHHYDALSVGNVPEEGYTDKTNGYVLNVRAMGRGTRLLGNINDCGIIKTKFKERSKTYEGFMTGDIVTANVPEKYKYNGKMTGRIAIRKTGNFDIWTKEYGRCNVKSIFCRAVQKQDGYSYCYSIC